MQKLLGIARKAIMDYNMISDGDKIAVGLSGGKDSIALLAILNAYRRFSPEKFELIGINIDMGFEATDKSEVEALKKYCADNEIELIIHKTDIAKIIFEDRQEKSPCSLCSKMRRGALNSIAIENGCKKLALGHHADDVIETMFLSLIYEGRFSTFSPVSYMDRTGMTLIRPLVYAEEKYLSGLARRYSLPIVHNPCPRDKHTSREDMKDLIKELDTRYKDSKKRILNAIFDPSRNNLWDTSVPPEFINLDRLKK